MTDENIKKDLRRLVVRVISGTEFQSIAKIKLNVEFDCKRKNLEIEDVIYKIDSPYKEVSEYKNGKLIEKKKVLVPGYVFIEFPLDKKDELFLGLKRAGFNFLRETNGDPKFISQKEYERMTSLSQQDETVSVNIEIGSNITVNSGSFKGLNGEVKEIYKEDKEALIIFEIFDKKMEVKLPLNGLIIKN